MQRTKTRNDQSKLKTNSYKDGSRRYDKGLFPTYDNEYHQLKKRSYILNKSRRARDIKNANALFGLSESKGTLLQLVGNPDKNDMYQRNGSWHKALIPSAKKHLKQVHAKFKQWQQKQIKNGKALKPPENWPDHLIEERLKAEALLDIRRREKAKVEDRIEELKEKRQKEKKKEILQHGPLGKITGGGENRITKADGQQVAYSTSGIPYISEPDSPYEGMPIFYYRKMCRQWKKEQGITLEQLRERRDEIFQKERLKAVQEEREPPVKRLVVTHRKVPVWMDRLGITKEDWPKWPDDAKPISEIEGI